MKKLFTITSLLLVILVGNISAQEKVNNLYIGVAPIGSSKVNFSKDGNSIGKFTYNSYFGASVSYEHQFNGVVTLSELSFAKAKLDEYDNLSQNILIFNPEDFDDLNVFSFMQYGGKTIFPKKRVQLPIFIGVGADYLWGDPLHNLNFTVGVKARLKFYFNSKIGIFIGGGGKYGFGSRSIKSNSYSKKNASIGEAIFYGEGGFMITI